MKILSRLLLARHLPPCCYWFAPRRMPRIGSAGRLMTGLGVWQSTLCVGTAVPFVRPYASSAAACIPRTKATKRMALSALMA